MPWRALLRHLSNNEELIRRLSESYPIRRAAQLTAYFFHNSKDKFLEQKGKYERAGGWQKTSRDLKQDLKDVQGVSKEYLSNMFRMYTDIWSNYKESLQQEKQKKDQESKSSNSSKTTSTIKRNPPK